MILILDNYDSFTFNLVQYFGEITQDDFMVCRNDEITLEKIQTLKPDRIVISPGPKDPTDVGICNDVISRFAPNIPILGVCLWPSMYWVRFWSANS
ncbi:Aminodeoxychorismate/anthranilate synthase component 2 [Atribacter laminatus]|uniref:Aminodeoxychorismate/anthranilate synthase component 2 n=1 Tax=Atribacter laminatus TaxID=2847778 RepID=A0A7T1AJ48_ATRLM|nr:hypothetical protein [Atribacter laminatus]QPM66862.1 Aminodeoxychorismate/anthranilate synthase component 2 [Atribacter laminatus]